MQESDVAKYCDLMGEVKRRMSVIASFMTGSSNALYMPTTVESVYLQFRKILELIAFGSLVANQQLFTKAYADFAKMWHAQRLLDDLKTINPDFYPEPIDEVPSKMPGARNDWVPKTAGFLTKDDFVALYKKCGQILHSENPYGTRINYEDCYNDIQGWTDKIIALTNCHLIKLVNDKNLYLVHMQEAHDDRVHHYVFAPMPKPSAAST